MSFHSPHLLWLLVPLLYVLSAWTWKYLRDTPAEVTYAKAPSSPEAAPQKFAWPTLLVSLGGILILFALAGPFHVVRAEESERVSQNIIIVADLSASMQMEDYFRDGQRISRLDASKSALVDYLLTCSGDGLGLITFAGEVKIVSPLTADAKTIAAEVKRIEIGQLKDGTAIGDAINVAISLFPTDTAGGRVSTILLLSDGADNRSTITPADAARKAARHGITIYAIGIGTDGIAPMPVFSDDGQKIGYRRAISDFRERELSEVAALTGGRFSHAVDVQDIFQVLRFIRTEQDRRTVTKQSSTDVDLRWNFAFPGVGLLAAGGLMKVYSRPRPKALAA